MLYIGHMASPIISPIAQYTGDKIPRVLSIVITDSRPACMALGSFDTLAKLAIMKSLFR
jgi:hypothetical protein